MVKYCPKGTYFTSHFPGHKSLRKVIVGTQGTNLKARTKVEAREDIAY